MGTKKGKLFDVFGKLKALPFWSWNGELEKDELTRQIERMKECGMGGFFMHARAGLKTEYLSEKWFYLIKKCAEKAKREGLTAWVYDENGWPSGIVGGEMLKDPANLEWYLECSEGASDENAFVSYDISGEKLLRLKNGESAPRALNVYRRTAVSSVDLLDGEVTDKFIGLTYRQYKKRLGEDFTLLSGFFTDEPQFCRKGLLYPHKIAEYFLGNYGEDVTEELGLLFIEKENYRRFRYRYYKACQTLFLNNFAKKLYDWCEENGMCLTGHYIEERDLYSQMLFNAGIMPFYKYQHIPGIDWLCRRFMSVVPARQVGSVAVQFGKKEVLTECFAMTGWDVLPKELKAIAEFQHFYGTNLICHHLVPYSEADNRKFDHPLHFSDITPWVKESGEIFNDYFGILGGFFSGTEEFVNVAVLHPVRSAYLCFEHGNEHSTKELDDAFLEFSEYLAKQGIGFHYLDETLLAESGFIKGDKIGCGKKEYDFLIIPKCFSMDNSTFTLITEFYGNGGKLLFACGKPQYLDGEPDDFCRLNDTVSLSEIIAAQPYRIHTVSKGVYSSYRKCGGFDCICLLNTDDDCVAECKVSVEGSLYLYDIFTGKETPCRGDVRLEPLQSAYIIVKKERASVTVFDKKPHNITLPVTDMRVTEYSDNALILDFAEYSKDGVNYTGKTLVAEIFGRLLKERYCGDVYLRFGFTVKSIPARADILYEYPDGAVTVNGKDIACRDFFRGDKSMRLADVSRFLRCGENTVSVKLRFFQQEKVYYALFGNGVTESLKNCIVYDTFLNNIYILGDFGVFTDIPFMPSYGRGVYFADEFYIDKPKNIVNSLIKDGFPFFSGSITLEREFYTSDTDVYLNIPGRYHFAKVWINDRFAGDLLFENGLDVSRFVKKGENICRAEIFTGNRNFYGPHHDARFDESLGVTPFNFSFENSFTRIGSLAVRKSYSLVETGIFSPDVKPWYSK